MLLNLSARYGLLSFDEMVGYYTVSAMCSSTKFKYSSSFWRPQERCGEKRSQRLAENSERSTRPYVKGGQENTWNQSGAAHTSLDTLRSYLLPTEVEKVPWPHTMAVVHLEHNH